ncbi:MAG TPA: hypothetical protein VN976_23470 [Verrucomicrobiae bacterium]|nr:hypothetical protein [Verrucomicrobiae bacterium]
MTIDEIKDKLFSVLNVKPSDEKDLVYALVKIRKTLEHDGDKQKYPLVNLFCNWLLHIELNNSTVAEILRALDDVFRKSDRARPYDFDPEGVFSDIVSLQVFRNELMEFLHTNDLPTVWVEDMVAWAEFLRFYGEEVRNTPLKLRDDKYPSVFIAQVVITACEPDEIIVKSNPQFEAYTGLKWEFTLKDGRKFVRTYTTNVPKLPPNWKTMGTK